MDVCGTRGGTRDDGFSMIELLVAIVVVGVLATVVGAAVTGSYSDAQAASCAADRRTVESAQEAYRVQNGGYATEVTLVDDQLLRSESDLHDIELDGDGYRLVGTGECDGVAVPAGTPAGTEPVGAAVTEWIVSQGSASNVTAEGAVLEVRGGVRVVAAEPWGSDEIRLVTTAQATRTNGYGLLFNATTNGTNRTNLVTGYTFQVDRGLGKKFAIRVWSNNRECSTPVALTPWPDGFDSMTAHVVQITATANTLVATVDGNEVMNVPDLAAAVAAKCSSFPVPDGTEYGFRTWGSVEATFTDTRVSSP